MDKDEALKLALEALENAIAVRHGKDGTKFVNSLEPNAIAAIKAALVQPAQEPAAWMCSAFDGEPCEQTNHDECGNPIPLYTTPPKRPWVGLTDDELYEIVRAEGRVTKADAWHIVENLKAKLKEKNI